MENFDDIVTKITKDYPKYSRGAYFFIRDALEFTIKNQNPDNPEQQQTPQHIPGQKLLEGIREYALLQYGPMTLTVFKNWNIKNCEDFGHIVFKLVDYGILSKTDADSIDDFKKSYNFHEAFQKPFLP